MLTADTLPSARFTVGVNHSTSRPHAARRGRIGRHTKRHAEGVGALDKPSRARSQPLEGDDKTRISFVDMGRAIAALLVVYSHIAHPWVQVKGENAPVVEFVETFSSEPMRMATQGIGQVAVPFFFLVSGFIVTPIAIRQGYRKFALNRFIRVYAPLLFVLLLTAAALWAGLEPQSTGQSQELTPWTMFTNWTLVNYILYPQVVLMPVAWTMIIEILFYLTLLALLPVLRRAVWLAIGIELTFVFVVLSSRSELNESWSLFAVNVSYLPILIIGQIVWATTSKKIPLWAGGVFGALAWMLYVYGDIIDIGRIDDSYNLAMSIAVMFFLMGYFAEPKLRQFRFWTAMSERSYSIYLLHGLGIFVTLGLLRPTVPFAIALPISLLVTAGLVEISYRAVERPSHEMARRLSRRVGNASKRGSGSGTGGPGAGNSGDVSPGVTGAPGAFGADADVAPPGVDHDTGAGEATVRIPLGHDDAGPVSSGPVAEEPHGAEPEHLRSAPSRPLPADRSRAQPPRAEPPRAEPPGSERLRAEPIRGRAAQPPPRRRPQPADQGADPRRDRRRAANPAEPHGADGPGRPPRVEQNPAPAPEPGQLRASGNEAKDRGSEQTRHNAQRQPDQASPPRPDPPAQPWPPEAGPPQRPVRQAGARRPQERRIAPRPPGEDGGPRPER